MQLATTVIMKSTNTSARAGGVFISLSTRRGALTRPVNRGAMRPVLFGKFCYNQPLPKNIFTKQIVDACDVYALWKCKLLTLQLMANMCYYLL